MPSSSFQNTGSRRSRHRRLTDVYISRDSRKINQCSQDRADRPLSEPNLLSKEAIRGRLSADWADLHIHCFETTTSTSLVARTQVDDGEFPCLIVANGQTKGRGRRGKRFYSPHGIGLYFSLAFLWDRDGSEALVTTMAAVAVCRVLEETFGIVAEIKWVNDIFIDGKKIGGILTEAISMSYASKAKAIIIGIGLNLVRPGDGYPVELRDKVGALSDFLDRPSENADGIAFVEDDQGILVINRNVLVAMIVNELSKIIRALPNREYLDEYRGRCFILGKKVVIDDGRTVVPTGVSDDGALIYLDENGRECELISGEISLVSY